MNPKTSLQGCLFPRFFLKAISVFVVATFLCSDLLAFPSQSSSQSGSLTSPQGGYDTSLLASASATSGKAQELVIPPELGTVTQADSESPKVFLIQDAHSIPDAQRSLEKLVEHLQGQYGVATVALEGAEGKLDPTLFKMFPDAEKRAAVFGGLIGSGELSGAAMASVLSPYKADYVGIENWGLYQEGVAAFLSGLEKQPEVNAQCATLNEELKRLKAKYYSSEAKEFDARLAAWNTDPSQLAGFLEYLSKFSRGNAQSARLNALFETLKSEKIRDPKLEAEVKKFARYAHEVAPSAKLNGLVQSYKTGSLTLAALAYEVSKMLGGQTPFSSKSKKGSDPFSPSLQALIANHEMLVSTKGMEFSKEFEAFLSKVGTALFTSPEAQETARLSRRLDLLGKLIRFELTREEWKELQSFSLRRIADRKIFSEISKLQDEFEKIYDLELTAEFYRFYDLAIRRESVFLGNIQKILNAQRSPLCAITGGFHTDGIAAKLKEQGISYAVISPAIKEIPKDNRYLEQMQGKVSWASYFRPRNGRIDLYDAFARATTERLLADSVERRGDSALYASRSTLNAKEWRDGIIRGLAAEGRVAEHAKYTRYIDSRAAERSPEFQSLKTSWTAKLEKFIERLRALGKNGQITEANIAKLLAQPANQTPYAVASVVPGSMGFDPTEKLKTPEMVMVTSAKRSEVRGDENSRESEIAAHLVRRSFTQYCKRYESLGARAQQRFEDADWTGSQQDVVEDDKTYHASINEAAKAVESGFPDKVTDPAFWDEVRYRFYIGFKQKEVGKDLAKVFFESVKRSAFKQQEEKQKGEQKEGRKVFAEYLDESLDKDWLPRREVHGPMKIDLEKGQRLGDAIKKAMQNYKFRAHMDDLYGNSILAGALLSSEFKKKFPQGGVRGAEFLDVPLFRNKEAYIFGRVFGRLTGQELSLPFIVCLAHSPKGIAIDAVLTEQSDISEVLTTTRSNLFGDLKHYHQILAFLRAYFPVRAKPSLFKIIGFNHVAKVQLLYELRERLRREKAKFVRAAGIEGKVMVVFNLPGYPYVMKVVRDETPKEGVRDADYVIGKYRKVREMDRVGRMMDYIGLHGVSFPQEAFDKDLLNELLRESSKEVRLEHGRVYFQHIFVQGKLIPLDIFTQSPLYSEAEKRQAILDYGKCILEVAQAGLFAGDVLIKNYGVSLLTGLPRVFSYDYDDLDGLLNWNFMLTPPPRNEDEEMMADDDRVMFRYTDVVVDQLERYMAPAQYRALFREHYGRFFTPEFWKDIQDKVRNGVFFESRSYPEKRRLSEIKKNIFLKWDASSEIGAGAPLDQESVSPVGPGNGQSKEASLPPMIKPQDLKFKFLSELSESERQSAKLLSYFQRARDEVGFWKDWNTDFWGDSNTDAILVSYKGEFVGAIAFIKRPDGSVLGNGGFVDPRLRGTGVGVVLRENLLRRLKDEKWAFFIIGGEESSVPITENTHHFRKSLEGRPGVSVFKDPNGFIRQVRVTLSRFEPLSKTQRKKLLMNLMIEKTIAKDPLVAGPAPEREGPQQQQRSEMRSAQTSDVGTVELPFRVSVVIGATLRDDSLIEQLRDYLAAPKNPKIHKQIMIMVDARSRELHVERFEMLRKLVEGVDPRLSGLTIQLMADPGLRGTSEATKNGIAASTGEAVVLAHERVPLSDGVFESLVAPLARGRSEVAYDASGLYTVVKARTLKEVKLDGRIFPINDEIHAKLKRLDYPSEIVSSLATEKVQPRSLWDRLVAAVADRVYSLLPVGNYYRGQYEFEKSMEAMAKLPRLAEGERRKVSVVIASRSGKRLFSSDEESEGQDALRIKVAEQLQPLFALNPSYDWELVIVDDATPGGKTGKRILKKAEALFPDYVKSGKIRVAFSPETKSQKGGGILFGMKDALEHHADYVVYTDVDLSADLRLIGALLERIVIGGTGIVIGSRNHPRSRVVGRGLFRDISSAFYHGLVCSMLPLRKIFDTQSGFKAFSREAALATVPEVKDIAMSFDTEFLVLGQEKGFTIEEVPIYWKDSQVGTSISILMQMFRMTEGLLGQRVRMLQRRLLQPGNSVITDLSILLTRVAIVGVRVAQRWLRAYLDTRKRIAALSFFKPRVTPEVPSLQEAKLEEQMVKDFSSIAHSIVGEAGRKLADYRKKLSDVVVKTKLEPGTDNATLVTESDEVVQRFVISEIQKLFPGHFVIAEETIEDEILRKNRENQNSDFVWVLDPIDGTKEFLKPESDFYAISLSLFYKGQPVLAVVQSPNAGVIEASADRNGVYWNGKEVHVSSVQKMGELHAVIDDADQDVLAPITATEGEWKSVAHGTRSVVLNLARIALSGDDTEAPAFFWKGGDRGPALWDIAGSSYLLKKAGGVALCLEGGEVLDVQEAVSRAILDPSKRVKHFSILAGTPAAMSEAAFAMEKVLSRGMADSTKSEDLVTEKVALSEKLDAIRARYALEIPENPVVHPVGHAVKPQQPVLVESRQGTFILKRIGDSLERARFVVSYQRQLNQKGILAVPRLVPLKDRSGEVADDFLLKLSDGYYTLEEGLFEGIEIGYRDARPKQFEAVGRLIATLQNATEGLTPEGKKNEEPLIGVLKRQKDFESLGTVLKIKERMPGGKALSRGEKLLMENLPLLLSQMEILKTDLPETRYETLPKALAPMDVSFHNMRFSGDGNTPLSVYDFGKLRYQSRLEDLKNPAMSVGPEKGRTYDRAALEAIVRGYQAAIRTPLTEDELAVLPEFIRGTFLWQYAGWFFLEMSRLNTDDALYRQARDLFEDFRKFSGDFPAGRSFAPGTSRSESRLAELQAPIRAPRDWTMIIAEVVYKTFRSFGWNGAANFLVETVGPKFLQPEGWPELPARTGDALKDFWSVFYTIESLRHIAMNIPGGKIHYPVEGPADTLSWRGWIDHETLREGQGLALADQQAVVSVKAWRLGHVLAGKESEESDAEVWELLDKFYEAVDHMVDFIPGFFISTEQHIQEVRRKHLDWALGFMGPLQRLKKANLSSWFVRKLLIDSPQAFSNAVVLREAQRRILEILPLFRADAGRVMDQVAETRMDRRVFRKQMEYQSRGLEFPAKEIGDILESRDGLDQQRLIEPVAPAPDSEVIDTSDMPTDEIGELMEEAIQRQQNRLRSETRTTGPMLGGGILEQDWPETRRVFRFLNGYNIHERPSGVLADLASKISGKLKLYVFLKKGDLGPVMLSSPYQVRNLNICYDQDVEILVKGEEPDDIRQDVAELVERAMQDGAMLEEEDRDNPRYASYLEELDRIWVKALAETGHVLTPDQEPKTWGERLAVGFKGFSLGAIVALPNAVAQGARQLLSGKSSTDAAGGFQGVQFYYQNEPVAGSASIQKAVAQLMASKQQFVFNAFVSEDNALTFGAFPRKYKRPGDDTEVRAAHSDIPRPKREFGVLECVLFYSEGAPMLILEPNHTGQPPLKQDFQKAFSDLVRLSRFMIASGFPGDLSLDTGTQSDIQTLFTEGFNQKMSVLPSTLRALSEEGIPETENVGAARSEMRGGREEVAATPAEPLYEHKPSSSAYEAYFDNILQIFREISYGTVEAFDVLADLLENQKKTEAKRRQRYGEDGRFFKDESRVYAPLQAILGHLDREPFAQNMELIAEFLLRLDDPWLFRWALSILHSNSIAPVQERPNALIAKRLLETVKEMAWGIAAPSYRVSVAALRELEEAPLSNPFYRILAEVYKNSKFKPASDEKIFFHGKRSRDERYMNTAQARKKAVEQMRKKELDEEMEQVLGRRGGREEVAEAPADFGGGGSALVEDEMTARSESRKEKEQPIFLSHDAEDEDSPVTQALILIETKIQDIQSILRELMKPAIPSTERVALDEILQSLQVMTNGFYNLSLSQENESRPGERQQYLKGVVEAWKETGRRFYAYSKSQTSEEGLSRVRQIKDLLDMVADYASGMVHMRIRRPARSLEDAVQTLVKADDLADYAGELVAAINRARKTKGEDPVSLATLTQNPEKFEADFFAPMYRLFSMKLQTDFKNAEPFIEEAQRIVASQGVFGLREALSRKEGPLLDLFKKIRHNGADRFISIDLYGQCIFFLTDNFEDYFGHIYDELIQTRPAIAIGRKFVSYHARAASTIDFREKMLLLGEDNPADPYRQDRDVSIFQKPALDQRNSAHAAKLRKAIEIWKARAAELGSEEMTRRIEHFEKAMTWVKEFSNKREGDEGSQDLAGQLPLIIADAELNTIRVVHADRMEHAMYFSAAYLESLDIHDPEDMKELAIWLNVSQKWLDLAPVSEPRTAENGRWDLTSLMSPAQRQDLDVEELRRDINDRFFEQEDTQLISSDRLKARMAALERQHVINRYQTFMDKVIPKEEFVAQKIREGKRLIRELPEHPEWDPSSKVRDPFRDAANACKELLLRYEAMGMRAQADRVFRLVLYMTSFVQFYDKGGLLPWSFQEDLIFIALRLGYWGHFLNEVSIYLKAREASVPGVHESVLEGFWRSGFPRAFEDNNVLEIENYRWRPGNWFFFRKLQSVMQSQLKASLPELFPERNRIVGEVYRLIKEAKEDPLGDLKKELGAAETTGKRSEMRDDPEDSAKPFGTKLVVPDGSVSYDLENAKEHPKDPKEVEKPWWIAAGASGYSRYQSWWNMFRSLLHVYETEFGRLPKYADARVKLERWHGVYAKDLLEIARLKTQKLRGKIELIRQKLEAGDDAAVRKNSWGLRSVRWLRSEPELETMVNLAEQVNRLANESVPRNKEKIQEKLGKLEERLALAESLLKFLKTYHEAYYQNRLAHSKWPHVLAREQAFEDSLASFPEASDAMKLLFFQFVYFSREKDSAAVAWLSKVIMATFAKKDPDQMMLALNEPERIPASVEKLAPLPILNALIRCLDIKADPKWSLSPQVPQGVSPFEFYFGLGANLSGRKGKDLLMERLRSLEAFHDIQWPLNGNETRIYEQIERIVADGYDFRLLVDPVTHVLTGVDKMESSANVPWRQQSRRRSEIRMNFITPGDTWAGRNDGTLRWGLGVLKQLGFDYASGPQKIGVVGVGIIPFDVQTAVNWVKAERGVESLPSDVRVIGFELPQAVPYAYIHVSDKAEGFNDLAAEILRRYAISRGDIKDIILSVRADKEMGSIVLRRDHRSADGTTYKTIAVAPDQTFVVTGEQTEEERYRNTDLFNAVRNWMGKERFRHFVESKEDREEGGIRIEFDPHDKFCKKWGAEFIPTEDLPSTEQRDLTLLTAFNVLLHMDPKEEAEFIARAETVLKDGRTDAEGKVIEPGGVLLVSDLVDNGMVDLGDFGVLYSRPESEERCFMKVNGRLTRISGFDPEYIDFWGRSRLNGLWLRGGDANPLLTYDPPDFHPWKPGVPVRSESREPISNLVGGRSGGEAEQKGPLVDQLPVRFDLREQSLEQTRAMHPELTRGNELFVLEARFGEFVPVLEDIAMDLAMSGPLAVTSLEHMKIQGIVQRSLDYFKKHGIAPVRMDILHALAAAIRKHDYKAKKHDALAEGSSKADQQLQRSVAKSQPYYQRIRTILDARAQYPGLPFEERDVKRLSASLKAQPYLTFPQKSELKAIFNRCYRVMVKTLGESAPDVRVPALPAGRRSESREDIERFVLEDAVPEEDRDSVFNELMALDGAIMRKELEHTSLWNLMWKPESIRDDDIRRALAGWNSAVQYWIAREPVSGRIAGILILEHTKTGEARVKCLLVHPDFWESGVGTQLMTAAFDAARKLGEKELRLETLAANSRARKFYRNLPSRIDGITVSEHHTGGDGWFARREPAYMYIYTLLPRSVPTPSVAVELDAPVPVLPADTRSESRTTVAQILFPGERLPGKLAEARIDLRNRFGEFLPALKSIADIIEGPKAGQSAGSFEKKYAAAGFIRRSISIHETNPNAAMEDERLDKLVRIIWNYASRQRINATEKAQARAVAQAKLTDAQRRKILGEKSQPYFEKIRQVLAEVKPGSALRKKIGGRTPEDRLFGEAEIGRLSALLAFDKSYLNTKDMAEVDNLVFRFETWRAARPEVREPISNLRGGIWVGAEQKGAPAHELEAGPLKASSFTSANEVESVYKGVLNSVLKQESASAETVRGLTKEIMTSGLPKVEDRLWDTLNNVFVPTAFAAISETGTLAPAYEALDRALRDQKMDAKELEVFAEQVFDGQLKLMAESIQKGEMSGMAPVIYYSPEMKPRLLKFIEIVQQGFDAVGDETGKQYQITLVSEDRAALQGFKTELSRRRMLRGVKFVGENGPDQIAGELMSSVIRHPVYGSKFGVFFPSTSVASGITAWQRVVYPEVPKEYAMVLLPALTRYFASFTTDDLNEETFATTLRQAVPDLFASARFQVGQGIVIVAESLQHLVTAARQVAASA